MNKALAILFFAATSGLHAGTFESLPAERTGIDFKHRWNPPAGQEGLISGSFTGGGVAIGDYDADGKPDLFFTGPGDGGALFRNLGDFKFENSTKPAGLIAGGWSAGSSWADLNGDGRLDLFVCQYGSPCRIYLNKGDGTFREVAEAAGLTFAGASLMAAFADYDRDGDLDLYLLTNRIPPPPGLMQERFEVRTGPDSGPLLPDRYAQYAGLVKMPGGKYKQVAGSQFDFLFRNDGVNDDGVPKFTDVSKAAGVWVTGYGLSATWWDYNDDGWQDLYVANDFYSADRLYRNNKDGTFTDVAPTALPHTPWFSMGSDVADINNDGLLDYMASDMAGSTHYTEKMSMGNMTGRESDSWFLNFPTPRQNMRNAVYLNSGTDRFMEAAHLCGLSATDWTWSVKFADFDCDGRDDAFITSGMSRDFFNSDLRNQEEDMILSIGKAAADRFWETQKPLKSPNWAFRNEGGLKFENVGEKWGLNGVAASYGAALGDLDGDFDLDIVVNNFDAAPSIYRNEVAGEKKLALRLKGANGNTWGVGAVLRAEVEGELQTKVMTLSRGFMSSNEPLVHIGLGEAEQIRSLLVSWASGTEQSIESLTAGKLHVIEETPAAIAKRKPTPQFSLSNMLTGIAHAERNYDDFARQPLLPNKLSQLGGATAWGDVNGDGLEDFYLGRARGHHGGIYIRLPKPNARGGHFVVESFAPFDVDEQCEDMTPLFFDADGDKDLDLFVVSGGVECEPGAAVLQDRLYLNDGKGKFTKAEPGVLPDAPVSGGAACVADFDADGDLDLFVGGRSVPGRYPETPRSQLLRNDSKPGAPKFTDITPATLAAAGMVTAAVWIDSELELGPDLVVATEWGGVLRFRNGKTPFASATRLTPPGWWTALAAADIDGDGDTDLIAGNTGLNTKYHPSPKKPALIYYGDMVGSGRKRIIEAKFEGDTLYPVRGLGCSSDAMPVLKERHKTFHSFASRQLSDLYGGDRLAGALKLEAHALESGVLVNEGGTFTFRPLPREAQIAPINAIAPLDVDADGDLDLCVVGNSFSPQPETGHFDGGLGWVLQNDGKGVFTSMLPRDSGLVVPGDARSISVTDLNRDGKPDLVVGINDGEVMGFVQLR